MLKKMFLFAVFALFATSSYAAKGTLDMTAEFDLPPVMKNCSVFRLKNDDFTATVIFVTHCPNAKTETSVPGKNPVYVVTNSIDNEQVELNPSDGVIQLNGDKYVPMESLNQFDLSKTIELNGKKYVKLNNLKN